MTRLPDDRDLVVSARAAAARFLWEHGGAAADPAAWPPELLSLVFANGGPLLEAILSGGKPSADSGASESD